MLQTRELFDTMTAKPWLSNEVLAEAVDALQDCEEAVAACAMGMIAEEDARQLAPAVSRDMDCVDIVEATRRVLTRGSGPDAGLLTVQLEACLLACERSNELCGQYAAHHAHCRMCSEATARCAATCRQVLGALRT
ncbi:hypothetical protein [Streptomyces kebangsaanensis]|uniref:hypothetical protein n=1 Tax=Streptomyces kebangsaanensis TaxID=864058 RepID=UPI00093F055D|nr:hypothetical protein [Streptomyces kebangsaanensis]